MLPTICFRINDRQHADLVTSAIMGLRRDGKHRTYQDRALGELACVLSECLSFAPSLKRRRRPFPLEKMQSHTRLFQHYCSNIIQDPATQEDSRIDSDKEGKEKEKEGGKRNGRKLANVEQGRNYSADRLRLRTDFTEHLL